VRSASRLRLRAGWDVETRTTAAVLRDLARRALALSAEADRHQKEILAIVRAWHPELLERLTRGCESTVSNALAAIAHRLRSYLADETCRRPPEPA